MKETIREFLMSGAGRACLVAIGIVLVIVGIRSLRTGRSIIGGAPIHVRETDVMIRGRRAVLVGWMDVLKGVFEIGFGITMIISAVWFPELLARGLRD